MEISISDPHSWNHGRVLGSPWSPLSIGPNVQSQVVIRFCITDLDGSAHMLSILQATIHRFQLDQISSPRALPTIFSSVLARIHGIHETIWQLCDDLLCHFSFQVAVQRMAGSALELLVHIRLYSDPVDQDMKLVATNSSPRLEWALIGRSHREVIYKIGSSVRVGSNENLPTFKSRFGIEKKKKKNQVTY